jgi:hypothetical protein
MGSILPFAAPSTKVGFGPTLLKTSISPRNENISPHTASKLFWRGVSAKGGLQALLRFLGTLLGNLHCVFVMARFWWKFSKSDFSMFSTE